MKTMVIPIAELNCPDVDVPAGFVRSVESQGIQVPIIVRATDHGRWNVVDGRRRVAALRKIGMKEVEAVTADSEDAVCLLLANIQRNPNPVLEAEHLRDLVQEHGWTQMDISRRLGISKALVTQRLKLLNLSPTLLERTKKGEIGARAAYRAAQLDEGSQAKLEEMETVTGLDVEVVRKEEIKSQITLETVDVPEIEPRARWGWLADQVEEAAKQFDDDRGTALRDAANILRRGV